ncbi:MAG: amidohydrolase [Oscillospiraceae bacterium]|nr:amidohydrolase [Oscillospiraceae bacterium]
MTADLIVKGKIYTADSLGSFAEAMAIAGGRIIAVGRVEDFNALIGEDTRIIEKSGLIIPGMTEGHAHVTCSSEMVFGVGLGHETDYTKYLDTIREYVESHPEDRVINGSGYDNGVFPEGGPTAEMLDSVCPDRPVIIVASDHHSRWVNSLVLKLIDADSVTDPVANEGIARYPDGRATGWLKEAAAMKLVRDVVVPMTDAQYGRAIDYYQDIALENGVTIAFEPMFDAADDYLARVGGYKYLDDRDGLKLTFRLGYTLNPFEDIEQDYREMLEYRDLVKDCKKVALTNAKFFVDGVVECHTALLREPYSDGSNTCGDPMITQEMFNDYALRAMRDGFDLHTHIIGDGAADIALEAYETAQTRYTAEFGKRDFRNSLTHLQLLWQDQIDRMAKNNIHATANPYWHTSNPIYYNELELPYLGEYRAANEYPLKSLLDAGITVSQASDFPVTVPPRSMDSLHVMVNRTEPGRSDLAPLNPKEIISVKDALDILTIGGAYQLRLDDRKGSLEPGKDADFAVLTDDVFEMQPQDLYKCDVAETWIGGVCLYTRM